MLYVCVVCEGVVAAEKGIEEITGLSMMLRAAVLKAERGLQRTISFASKEERLPRASRCGVEAMRLPSSLTAHIMRRHGHAFCVLSTPNLEAEIASRCCEQMCTLYGAEVLTHAQSRAGGDTLDDLEEPPLLAIAAAARSSRMSGNGSRMSGSGARRSEADAGGSTCSVGSSSRASSRWPAWTRRGRPTEARPSSHAPDAACVAEKLEALLREQNAPERLARVRRVNEVQNATREVASVMEESIDRVLATRENIEVLEDKSEWLLAQATAFRRVARDQRRVLCCRSLKLSLMIGLPLCCVLSVGVLLALQYAGVVHLWGNSTVVAATASLTSNSSRGGGG